MGRKLCPKIILEGTRLTKKTEIAFALNEHPRIVGPRKYRYHSPLVSGEWCAFTNYPWGRGLINFNKEEEQKAMVTYDTWVKLFELLKYYSWIVDRFHISTQMYQKMANFREYDFKWLEERLKVSGNPSQYNNLNLFIEEQNKIREIVNNSLLPVYHLDVSDNSVENAVERIADWLEETGGLYMR